MGMARKLSDRERARGLKHVRELRERFRLGVWDAGWRQEQLILAGMQAREVDRNGYGKEVK